MSHAAGEPGAIGGGAADSVGCDVLGGDGGEGLHQWSAFVVVECVPAEGPVRPPRCARGDSAWGHVARDHDHSP